MEELKKAVENRNKAEADYWKALEDLQKAIREDAKIAEGQRDIWLNQQSGTTDWRG